MSTPFDTSHRTRPTKSRARRLTAAIAGAAAVLTAASTLATTIPATAVPGVPASAFDPNTTSWYSYRDQSSSSFSTTFNALKGSYIPTDIDIETSGGYAVGSVWQKNPDGRSWKEKRNLTSSQFASEWNSAKAAGMRTVEQETYLVNGERRWAGIWVKNVEGNSWASHRGQTNAQFVASFNAHRDAGLMPVDYDEYLTSSGLRYNSVWVKAPARTSWKLYRGLSSTGYGNKFDELKSAYRVLNFDSLKVSSGQRYAGIWIQNTNGRAWAARRDMGLTSYKNYWYRYRDLGYRVVAFNRYQTASGTRYSAVWRQNDDNKIKWSLRSQVDSVVQQELDSTDVPGISVAVYQNGKAVYTRGFGNADIDDNVWMDSTHVGSTASVSKAIGGTLAFRMQEQGLLDIDDDTRDHVPSMPSKHSHTVGDLLANRGCVRHYADGDGSWDDTPYATALAASKKFWNDNLVCTQAQVGTPYNYSTHGYTLAGAAMEAAGNDDIKDLLRKKLTTPFKLGTLGPQNFSSSVHRMSLYTSGNDEVDTPNNDWKVLGGGVDSSAADLAGFGSKLIGGQILSAASRNEMWTPPNGSSNYAHGWSTGTEDGTQVVAKNGSWTGNLAYLRLYPQKGISVAVIMNDRSGDQSATGLGQDIGALVLDSLG